MNRLQRSSTAVARSIREQTLSDHRVRGPIDGIGHRLDESKGAGYAITYSIDKNALSRIQIWFDPIESNSCVHAEKINFHQICKIFAQRPGQAERAVSPKEIEPKDARVEKWMTRRGWFLDEYTMHYPSYYIRPDGTGGVRGKSVEDEIIIAELEDIPGPTGTQKSIEYFERLMYNKKKKSGNFELLRFEFVTFAVCESGKDKEYYSEWYEGLSWYWHLHAEDVHRGSKEGQWRGMSSVRKRLYGVPEFFREAVDTYRSKRNSK